MNLLNYIRGNRKGKNAHSIEKDAMTDPFLNEALEGFDSVQDDHIARLQSMQQRLNKQQPTKHATRSLWTSVAAVAIVVIVAGGSLLLLDNTNNGNELYAQAAVEKPIDIYIPEAIYSEHIAVIARRNTELTKDVSVKLNGFENKNRPEFSTGKISSDVEMSPIDIYIPTKQQ